MSKIFSKYWAFHSASLLWYFSMFSSRAFTSVIFALNIGCKNDLMKMLVWVAFINIGPSQINLTPPTIQTPLGTSLFWGLLWSSYHFISTLLHPNYSLKCHYFPMTQPFLLLKCFLQRLPRGDGARTIWPAHYTQLLDSVQMIVFYIHSIYVHSTCHCTLKFQ